MTVLKFAPRDPRKSAPQRDAILLLRLADAIDSLVLNAILEQKLQPTEVAAILAHRLGNLTQTLNGFPGSEAAIEIAEFINFLEMILKREAGIADTSADQPDDPEASFDKSS